MSGRPAAFYPPGSPEWHQEQLANQVPSNYIEPPKLECDHCGGYIENGEEAVELLHGTVSPGERSGRLMVHENPSITTQPVAVVHPECAGEYIACNVCDWVEDDIRLCEACETRMEGDG